MSAQNLLAGADNALLTSDKEFLTTSQAGVDSAVAQPAGRKHKYLLLTAHDYRSPRKAGIHFVARELAKLGPTRFFSLRYSLLSRFKHDPRLSLDKEANKVVVHQGVECYLWKTLVHPIRVRPFETLMYYLYGYGFNRVLRAWIRDADVIVLESGVAPIFFDLIKRLNPQIGRAHV